MYPRYYFIILLFTLLLEDLAKGSNLIPVLIKYEKTCFDIYHMGYNFASLS